MKTLEKEPISEYTVRFQDCDPMGHLNNARFIDYLINAREDHLFMYYGLNLADFMKKGIGWVIASHEILYRRPALYNERIKIRTALLEYTDSDLLVEGIVTDEKETHLKALIWTRFVHVNIHGKKEQHNEEITRLFESICVHDRPASIRERLMQFAVVKNK
jgi:YbgC/YbaW family acyl-CoA thioester hydrolase